jgi:hypothetical protein
MKRRRRTAARSSHPALPRVTSRGSVLRCVSSSWLPRTQLVSLFQAAGCSEWWPSVRFGQLAAPRDHFGPYSWQLAAAETATPVGLEQLAALNETGEADRGSWLLRSARDWATWARGCSPSAARVRLGLPAAPHPSRESDWARGCFHPSSASLSAFPPGLQATQVPVPKKIAFRDATGASRDRDVSTRSKLPGFLGFL